MLETIATSGAKWFWEEYGKTITDKALRGFRGKWSKFKWSQAETQYRSRLREIYSTTRLLGHPKPIEIEDIFTDVFILDQLSAFQRYSLQELQEQSIDKEGFHWEYKRKPILNLVKSSLRLFILGKPGAGKTTLLKYLTLQACLGKIGRTPIFISLKEWADSDIDDILDFIVLQFDLCSFPDAKLFIETLLNKGAPLVMFDGLDEVNQAENQRMLMIHKLTNFAKKYHQAQIFVTCRVASVEYSFDQFTYVEIADFDDRQIQLFISKWYQDDQYKLEKLSKEIEKPDNKGIKELARTPLLLALICLAFDETLKLPERRVDLYREALDALIRKWDASRGIQRDTVYRYLSPARKEQMFGRIAAQNFQKKRFYIGHTILVKQVDEYLQQLPILDLNNMPPDNEAVITEIEAQHGIIVQQAHKIYSFAHLSFQEYYTARHIVENSASGEIVKLIKKYLFDDQWREIFLLTSSLLDNADSFCNNILDTISNILYEDKTCSRIFRWIQKKSLESDNDSLPRVRVAFLLIVLSRSFESLHKRFGKLKLEPVRKRKEIALTETMISDLTKAANLCATLFHTLTPNYGPVNQHIDNFLEGMLNTSKDDQTGYQHIVASAFNVDLTVTDMNLFQQLTSQQISMLIKYLHGSNLLVECLNLAVVSNRKKIKDHVLYLRDQSSKA